MRYRIRHATEYYYGDSVPQCHNALHLTPRRSHCQQVLSHSLAIAPNPMVRFERTDFFGNHVTWFSIQEPHDVLSIVAKSDVEVGGCGPPTGFSGPAWEQVAADLQRRREPDFLGASQFAFDSNLISLNPELAEYARRCFGPGRPLFECVSELTRTIFAEFKFDPGTTQVGTPVLDVLHHRFGVCQDFAHVEIGCLRSLGLAARYVSGYLVTKPPPGRARLIGADTSHAWISVFFPNYGWIDFDPTNGVIPSSDHITLAWGRDYDDISPIRGVVVGGGRHSMSVSVDVEPIAPPPTAGASMTPVHV